MSDCHGCPATAVHPPNAHSGLRTVAIVGPPNAGKSTLFNRLTGLRQKVANFPGVTVEEHVGRVSLTGGREVDLIDLPGIYSLEPRSEDEQVTRDALKGELANRARPDAVILILDSTNLGRHPDAGRSDPGAGTADAGCSEYGRRPRFAGRERGCRGTLVATGCTGGSGQRGQRRGTGADLGVSLRAGRRPGAGGTAGPEQRAAVPGLGEPGWQ